MLISEVNTTDNSDHTTQYPTPPEVDWTRITE